MKPRILFARSGGVIRTQRPFTSFLWPFFGCAVVLALLAGGSWLDADRELFAQHERAASATHTQRQAELQDAYEAGRRLGRTEVVESARTIWQAAVEQCTATAELQRAHRSMP